MKKGLFLKTREEIELIRLSSTLLSKAHGEVAKLIDPGVSTAQLDKCAEEYIRDYGAVPSFKGYNGFPASLCISINDKVVHGMPSDYHLKETDIVSVDCGVLLNGYHSDSAYTYALEEVDAKTLQLLEITKAALYVGISYVQLGARIGDIGHAIQTFVEKNGFSVVRELVGHGVGRSLHESPEVPNFGKRGQGMKLQNGLVIAIEPMVNLGSRNIVQEKDGWTIRTSDRKPSAHFEHTVGVSDGKADILTTFEFVEEVLQAKYGKTIIN